MKMGKIEFETIPVALPHIEGLEGSVIKSRSTYADGDMPLEINFSDFSSLILDIGNKQHLSYLQWKPTLLAGKCIESFSFSDAYQVDNGYLEVQYEIKYHDDPVEYRSSFRLMFSQKPEVIIISATRKSDTDEF